MSEKLKSILKRLLKGFLSGALTSMSLIAIFVPTDYTQLKLLLNTLLFSAIAGGINGIFLAINKWYSWQDTVQ